MINGHMLAKETITKGSESMTLNYSCSIFQACGKKNTAKTFLASTFSAEYFCLIVNYTNCEELFSIFLNAFIEETPSLDVDPANVVDTAGHREVSLQRRSPSKKGRHLDTSLP